VRPVGAAIVREHSLDGDAAISKPLDGAVQDAGGGLVVVDLGVGDARRRIPRLTHRFVVDRLVLFGEDLGRDDRSCIGSPARYRSDHRFTVGQDTWKRAATSLIGHPSSTR
jgi:hypothetical protein